VHIEDHPELMRKGLAQVIVQSTLGGKGTLTLRETAQGLRPAESLIDV
jgi:hypothetical protein